MNAPEGSDQTQAAPSDAEIARGEIVEAQEQMAETVKESVEEPGRVMRIGSMIKQLLDEVRAAELDDAGRNRLREIYDQSIAELSGALSEDLAEELDRLASPFGDVPASSGELRVAQAQLVGWLEGLFHGSQATLFAQQAAARQQLEQMRHQLAAGQQPGGSGDGHAPGTYL